ncbi:hypothetical protein ACEXOS_013580 [Herbiconiux sp. P16]|uniref:hypothetical protein n=1 Tax=Herbiconiux wuyangfengii TaxID=3342794 RepID=UPI0035B6CE77
MEMMRRRHGILAAVAVAVLALAGCTLPDEANGQRLADWIAEQDHVNSATPNVQIDRWERRIGLKISIAPDISDDELTALASAVERRTHDSGWSDPAIDFDLGHGRSFSNAGGAPTLAVFLGMRHEERYLVASARGRGGCDAFFCVTMTDDDPIVLLHEVNRLLAVAQDVGDIQCNLDFGASDESRRSVVVAEPDAPIDDAVRLWKAIAQIVPLTSGYAWPIEPVGDLPPAQMLELEVPNDAAQAVAEAVAARQSRVDVTVTVSSPATPAAR